MSTSNPTPQGISALLRRAGFKRAVASKYSITYSGYHVRKPVGFPAGTVQVNHWGIASTTIKQENDTLLRYAKAITAAGYRAEVDEIKGRLIVTAKEG